jgi:CBS domain-containing protein
LTVKRFLARKPPDVRSVGVDAMVLDAVKVMVEHDVGAVLVLDAERVIGIFPNVTTHATAFSAEAWRRVRRCAR